MGIPVSKTAFLDVGNLVARGHAGFHLFPKALVHLPLAADAQPKKAAEGGLHCFRTQPRSATHCFYSCAIGEGRSCGRMCTLKRELQVRTLGGQPCSCTHSTPWKEYAFLRES